MVLAPPPTAGAPVKVRRALLSVFDKQGLPELARALGALGIEIVSTGGTAEVIAAAGVPVVPVETLTGFPEMLGGRVKTLHPAIHAALLHQRDVPAQVAEVRQHGIRPIELVITSLYPFGAVDAQGAELGVLLEHIDIGGPAMIRAAAKNFPHVAVVTSPDQYAELIRTLEEGGGAIGAATRRAWATAAFAATAAYDQTIVQALARRAAPTERRGQLLPPTLVRLWDTKVELRYGENPDQEAAFYSAGPAAFRVLQGKELSYNNLLDVDAAAYGVQALGPQSAVIIKHGSPSGAAVARGQAEAFEAARAADPLSAFGGIVGLDGTLEAETARRLVKSFFEVVVAPAVSPAALKILAAKKKLTVVECDLERCSPPAVMRSAAGGILVQERDRVATAVPPTDATTDEVTGAETVSRAQASPETKRALALAWITCQLVRSNAVVLATAEKTIGIGGGQQSRIDAVELAGLKAHRAGHDTQGAVLASDGFFPFRDSIDRARALGVTAVIQPGGSRRDAESIQAADEHGIALLLTGKRHFLH